MRSKRPYKTAAWLTIVLFTPVVILSYSGQVLCVGEDDHMQVEYTSDPCCDLVVPNSEAAQLTNDFNEPSGCGDCSDLDLGRANSMRVLSRSAAAPIAKVFPGMAWLVAATATTDCTGKQSRRDKYEPTLTQAQLSVSTTILIC